MHQVARAVTATIVDGLLKRIEDEVVRSEFDTRQPTMRRANTSMTKAT